MSIRLVCILLRLDVSGSDRQELSSSEVPLRAREKEMHVRSSKEGWTSHSPNLHSRSVCRLTEAAATRPGTNSITGSWLAGERAAALGKVGGKTSLLFLKQDSGEEDFTINQKSESGARTHQIIGSKPKNEIPVLVKTLLSHNVRLSYTNPPSE